MVIDAVRKARPWSCSLKKKTLDFFCRFYRRRAQGAPAFLPLRRRPWPAAAARQGPRGGPGTLACQLQAPAAPAACQLQTPAAVPAACLPALTRTRQPLESAPANVGSRLAHVLCSCPAPSARHPAQMTHANVGSLLVFDPSKLHLVKVGRAGAGGASPPCAAPLPASGTPQPAGLRPPCPPRQCGQGRVCSASQAHSTADARSHPCAPSTSPWQCGKDQVCNASKDAVVGIITERGEQRGRARACTQSTECAVHAVAGATAERGEAPGPWVCCACRARS